MTDEDLPETMFRTTTFDDSTDEQLTPVKSVPIDEAAARDVIAEAIQPGRQQHGQHCPVWTRKAKLADCDCWILPGINVKAERAASRLLEAGYLRENAVPSAHEHGEGPISAAGGNQGDHGSPGRGPDQA